MPRDTFFGDSTGGWKTIDVLIKGLALDTVEEVKKVILVHSVWEIGFMVRVYKKRNLLNQSWRFFRRCCIYKYQT